VIGEYPDLEPGRLNDCRLDCDISRLEGRRRWDEVGLWVGVRGGEDMVEIVIVEAQDRAEMFGASELGRV
jgi:hypothetical protein